MADITVDELLTHTSGGWPNDANDPMMHNDGWDQTKLITETIANVPLTNAPGTHWALFELWVLHTGARDRAGDGAAV